MAKVTAAERRVYEAVLERSRIDGIPSCEYLNEQGSRCGHNGTRWPLEMAHIIPRSRGGKTALENIRYLCRLHHKGFYHGERIKEGKWKSG